MAKEIVSGIYKIVNLVNGKCYVGQAQNCQYRWAKHRLALLRGEHHSEKLQRAWNKYGPSAFDFVVIEVVSDGRYNEREQHWMDTLLACGERTGYNISPTAGSPRGVKHSAETRAKLSKLRKGKKLSAETRAKLSAAHTGKKMSDESRAKLSAQRKGKKQSPEAIANRAAALIGRKMSQESIDKTRESRRLVGSRPENIARLKTLHVGRVLSAERRSDISKKLTGRPVSQATRERIRASHVGKKVGPLSSEHREKISKALTGVTRSEETRRRMSEAQKTRSPEQYTKMIETRRRNKEAKQLQAA